MQQTAHRTRPKLSLRSYLHVTNRYLHKSFDSLSHGWVWVRDWSPLWLQQTKDWSKYVGCKASTNACSYEVPHGRRKMCTCYVTRAPAPEPTHLPSHPTPYPTCWRLYGQHPPPEQAAVVAGTYVEYELNRRPHSRSRARPPRCQIYDSVQDSR